MSGKPNTKWLETMIRKHGSREAVRAWQKEIGRKGGLVKGTQGGFAANPELARIAGAKGGRISRRGPSKKTEDQRLEESLAKIGVDLSPKGIENAQTAKI